MKVLIIDDSIFTLELHKALVENCHEIPLLAESGSKALEIYQAQKPEIILCDIMMPEMDGYEVFSILKEINPDVFLYFISAEMTAFAQKKARDMKASGFYQKPIGVKEILEILQHYRDEHISQIA